MNLLMLLSALLSALTGVGGAVRRPEVAQAVAQVAAAGDVARTAITAKPRRPTASLPTLRLIAGRVVTTGLGLMPSIALWASRRRE